MPVTVFIPNALRKKTGNSSTVTASGQTVREIITTLDQSYPGLFFHLCYETGELRPYVNVFLNGEDVRRHKGLDTPVPPDATMHILQSVAGG